MTYGDYAAWTATEPVVQVYWRNVATDSTTQVVNGSYSASAKWPSVASNGNLAFSLYLPNQVNGGTWRYAGGVLEKISGQFDARAGLPLTDGVNIAYRVHKPLGGRSETCLVLGAGGSRIQLDPGFSSSNLPEASYAVAGGWTAFTSWTLGGVAITKTRAPDGTIASVSVINADSTVDAISETGEVVYTAGARRYVGRAGGTQTDFSDNGQGRIVYHQGWYEILGQLLLRYDASAGDGGVNDAGGSPDATIDASAPTSDAAADSTGVADVTDAPIDSSGPTSDANTTDTNGGTDGADASSDASGPISDASGAPDVAGRDATASDTGTARDASDAGTADVASSDIANDRSSGNDSGDAAMIRSDAATDGSVPPHDDSTAPSNGCDGCSTSSKGADGTKTLTFLGLLGFAVIARRRKSVARRPISAFTSLRRPLR